MRDMISSLCMHEAAHTQSLSNVAHVEATCLTIIPPPPPHCPNLSLSKLPYDSFPTLPTFPPHCPPLPLLLLLRFLICEHSTTTGTLFVFAAVASFVHALQVVVRALAASATATHAAHVAVDAARVVNAVDLSTRTSTSVDGLVTARRGARVH
eukprot:GHVS01009788.1.p1 GENE.GHVS01009788.1~~GHVS01009788.1.p1  ORF type:complete len:153 (-),score=27.64 GHVS01009788.1:14-472(-)